MSAIPLHNLGEVATKGDISLLRAELKTEITNLRAELKTEMASAIGDLSKSMTAWMLTILVTIIGSMIGVGLLV